MTLPCIALLRVAAAASSLVEDVCVRAITPAHGILVSRHALDDSTALVAVGASGLMQTALIGVGFAGTAAVFSEGGVMGRLLRAISPGTFITPHLFLLECL